ncbi:MAG: cob(I)yrinic acid a,c-diamide adenosyltransferase [Candidatus Brocadiia bacterium]
MQRGLVIVITGHGKGKTTSALGAAFRAVGQGLKVLIIQFLKSSPVYGEITTARRLAPDLEIIQAGRDCVFPAKSSQRFDCHNCDFACHVDPKNPSAQDKDAAASALKLAHEKIASDKYGMVILDEINYAVDYGLISIDDVLNLIQIKPDKLHLILTGRNAPPQLTAAADLVSEILEIKHPFQDGLKSVKGIDY